MLLGISNRFGIVFIFLAQIVKLGLGLGVVLVLGARFFTQFFRRL